MTDASGMAKRRAATLKRKGRFTVAELLFEPGSEVMVGKGAGSQASIGDLVVVEVGPGRAKVVERIGSPQSASDVIKALLVDRGLPSGFSKEVEKEAARQKGHIGDGGREDLTDEPTFTVDPATAKDHDDAISIARSGDGMMLRVHIADVSLYVDKGSAIEAEAASRGCSVYLPGLVVPMLPHSLSSDACSLVPGGARPAVTVEILVGPGGEVESRRFFRSLINSDARLTYDQVDDLFQGRVSGLDGVGEELALARRLARELRQARHRRGALELVTAAPEIEFDGEGGPISVRLVTQTESQNLIEEFMVLANEQVASHLEGEGAGLLYRIHDRPAVESILFLVEQLDSLDIPTPPLPDHLPPDRAWDYASKVYRAMESFLKGREHGREAYTTLLLRSLQQAVYSPRNKGHAGLASPCYCHFTSPIRRYPDLVVHRALLQATGCAVEAHDGLELERAGWHSSMMERAAIEVERDANDICLAYLLRRTLDEEGWDVSFEGEIAGMISAGAFIRFGAFEGFLPARRLPGGYHRLNESATALIAKRSGNTLRLGDPVEVTVERVDWHAGRVDLKPAMRND